jgi:hypothetical protein
MRTRGLRGTAKKLASFLGARSRSSSPRAAAIPAEVLNLQPGEFVEVRSAPEILATLDADSRLRGLAFLPEMLPYCGKRFRVFRRLEKLFLEESRQIRRTRNTVLLEGVMCDGKALGCDRSCFLFWREAWLKRVGDGALSR